MAYPQSFSDDVSAIHASFILINHTVSEELDDAAIAQTVPGAIKSLLFFCMSSF